MQTSHRGAWVHCVVTQPLCALQIEGARPRQPELTLVPQAWIPLVSWRLRIRSALGWGVLAEALLKQTPGISSAEFVLLPLAVCVISVRFQRVRVLLAPHEPVSGHSIRSPAACQQLPSAPITTQCGVNRRLLKLSISDMAFI